MKYLFHCARQLWLYSRGIRPEHLSGLVQLGEAIHDTTYTRQAPVDLGAARLDYLDGQAWVHEVKSARQPSRADEAQAMHYCDYAGSPLSAETATSGETVLAQARLATEPERSLDVA